ncbi:Cytoplasmic protein NCK1-like [Oopsacas minuta]|uniref:Cytoplasmic protein NCK1-like n=1 Tax=Oopsacas minuta TaxID=111878 RepID=A0AAV7JPE3_9METZ|nr:Cytoplasmic protein NCK1-like [Oopsacas minuta]
MQILYSQKVQIVFKSYDGWWRVKCGESTGIVPSLYLTETEHQQRKETLERNTNKELYVTPSTSFNPPPRKGTYGRNEKIVSMYSVLEDIPKDVMNKSSVKYAQINKSKSENKNKKLSTETEDIIHKMLDISLESNPDISLNYEMSDDLVKEVKLTQSLMGTHNQSKHLKPPKPVRKYINPQEVPANLLQRSPSTPSFVDNSIYQNFEKASHTNILSRPIDNNDRSLKLNRNKCSASKDDEEIDYINWLPSIDPINIDDVNEYTVSSPFGRSARAHTSLKNISSMPQKILPKIFVAIEKYNAQDESCVSFKDGDNATLIEKSQDGLWSFVRVNAKEGWSPSDHWKPIALKKPGIAPPPNIKPTRLTKTVATSVETPSPASRRLSSYEKRPLPVPPARNHNKTTDFNSTAPASSRLGLDLPDIPHRTKSPKTLVTQLQPLSRDVSKSQHKDNHDQYLWGKMTRKACEDLLLQRAKQGEFIFRESPNREGELVLSMRYHYRVHHFNIKQEDSWFCIGENFRVKSLTEIISHFQKTPIASYKEHGDKLIDVFLSRPLDKNN